MIGALASASDGRRRWRWRWRWCCRSRRTRGGPSARPAPARSRGARCGRASFQLPIRTVFGEMRKARRRCATSTRGTSRRCQQLARRGRRRAAARCLTEVLPADALGLVLYQLPLAHDTLQWPTATCSVTPQSSPQVAAFSNEVVTLANQLIAGVPAGPCCPWRRCDGALSPATARSSRFGMTARASAPSRRLGIVRRIVMAVAVLPGGARFVSGSVRRHRKAVDARRRSRRTFEVGTEGSRRGAARRRALWVGLGWRPVRTRSAVPRRRDARPHLQGAHRLVQAVAVTLDGQHIISGSDDMPRQGVERRHQEPREHLRRAHRRRCRWRRCPTASASSAAVRRHRPRVAPRRHPQEHLRAAHHS